MTLRVNKLTMKYGVVGDIVWWLDSKSFVFRNAGGRNIWKQLWGSSILPPSLTSEVYIKSIHSSPFSLLPSYSRLSTFLFLSPGSLQLSFLIYFLNPYLTSYFGIFDTVILLWWNSLRKKVPDKKHWIQDWDYLDD